VTIHLDGDGYTNPPSAPPDSSALLFWVTAATLCSCTTCAAASRIEELLLGCVYHCDSLGASNFAARSMPSQEHTSGSRSERKSCRDHDHDRGVTGVVGLTGCTRELVCDGRVLRGNRECAVYAVARALISAVR
jgi:hypothetical protein